MIFILYEIDLGLKKYSDGFYRFFFEFYIFYFKIVADVSLT